MFNLRPSGNQQRETADKIFKKIVSSTYNLGTGMGRAFLKDPQKAFEFKRRLDTIFK